MVFSSPCVAVFVEKDEELVGPNRTDASNSFRTFFSPSVPFGESFQRKEMRRKKKVDKKVQPQAGLKKLRTYARGKSRSGSKPRKKSGR